MDPYIQAKLKVNLNVSLKMSKKKDYISKLKEVFRSVELYITKYLMASTQELSQSLIPFIPHTPSTVSQIHSSLVALVVACSNSNTFLHQIFLCPHQF